MSLPEKIFLVMVLLAGISSAFRLERAERWRLRVVNMTAIGILLSYSIVQGLYYFTEAGRAVLESDDNVFILLLADAMVITAIYCKPPSFNCLPYHGLLAQLCALWWERSYWDRVILAIFPMVWAVYALPMGEGERWWRLYWLALAQLLAAAFEAFGIYRSRRAANAEGSSSPDAPSSGVQFALAGGGGGYG